MTDRQTAASPGAELVFALCHEVGNLLAAIRLQAHLLDDELGPRGLAVAAVEIDDLCARAGALMSQVRPLLADPPREPRGADPRVVVGGVQQALQEAGVRGVALDFDVAEDLPAMHIDAEVLHPILLTQLYGAVGAARPDGAVRVAVSARGGEVAIAIEDEGASGEWTEGWRDAARQGRPLACTVADQVLRPLGGAVEVARDGARSRVVLTIPAR